jgi:hypothetical protein
MLVFRPRLARWHDARLIPGLCGLAAAFAALLVATAV